MTDVKTRILEKDGHILLESYFDIGRISILTDITEVPDEHHSSIEWYQYQKLRHIIDEIECLEMVFLNQTGDFE